MTAATKIVTLFEHEEIAYASLGLRVDHPILQTIEDLNRVCGQEVIKVGRRTLRAGHMVGVLAQGDYSLQILPKIDYTSDQVGSSSETEGAILSATSNLLHMLSYAYGFRTRNVHTALLATRRGSWLEVLTRIFSEELHRLVRGGIDRGYVSVTETVGVLRGRWEIERQLTRGPLQKHLFDVVHDEFSEDTPLNRIFKFTVELLLGETRDAKNRSLLLDLREWFLEVARLPLLDPADLDQIHLTRLNERYQSPYNLAKLLLECRIPVMQFGDRPLTAFLLDMDLLFQRFVAGFLSRHFSEIVPEDWSSGSIRSQMKGKPTYLMERLPTGQANYQLIPDLCLESRGGQVWAILDTKYKALDLDSDDLSPTESDVYQVLVYCDRLGSRVAALVFPSVHDMPNVITEYRTQRGDVHVLVSTVNLHRPLEIREPLVAELRGLLGRLNAARIMERGAYGTP
jgi:5-methylcytosine-specific restriction enzyme subunit McrC